MKNEFLFWKLSFKAWTLSFFAEYIKVASGFWRVSIYLIILLNYSRISKARWLLMSSSQMWWLLVLDVNLLSASHWHGLLMVRLSLQVTVINSSESGRFPWQLLDEQSNIRGQPFYPNKVYGTSFSELSCCMMTFF